MASSSLRAISSEIMSLIAQSLRFRFQDNVLMSSWSTQCVSFGFGRFHLHSRWIRDLRIVVNGSECTERSA